MTNPTGTEDSHPFAVPITPTRQVVSTTPTGSLDTKPMAAPVTPHKQQHV